MRRIRKPFWNWAPWKAPTAFILAQHPGVKRVVALEGREANLRKARFVQELLQIPNVEFAQANLEHADLTRVWNFDAVFCCGLLYHLPEPWKLIEQCAAVAPLLFIWTQYAAENEAHDVGTRIAREDSCRRRSRTNRSVECRPRRRG